MSRKRKREEYIRLFLALLIGLAGYVASVS